MESYAEILSQIKSIIIRLNHEKGWNPDFCHMVPSSKLKDYGIFHWKERGFFQEWFGSYIDIAELDKAVNKHFNLKQYDDRRLCCKWEIVDDVAVSVYRRVQTSTRMKEYWVKRKANKKEEKTRGEERERREEEARQQQKERQQIFSNSRAFYLDILELPPTATIEEIRKRYRELVNEAHPDHGGNPHHFRVIQKAYENLVSD